MATPVNSAVETLDRPDAVTSVLASFRLETLKNELLSYCLAAWLIERNLISLGLGTMSAAYGP